jgi:hypothetical protein
MPDTPLTEQLAANMFGPPTGDLLHDALRSAALMAAARVTEMTGTGFGTNSQFDHDYLTPRIATQEGIFTITSLGTGSTYLVVLNKRVGDTYQAIVQVYNPNTVSDRFYRMTLVRADNGSIRMNAGW